MALEVLARNEAPHQCDRRASALHGALPRRPSRRAPLAVLRRPAAQYRGPARRFEFGGAAVAAGAHAAVISRRGNDGNRGVPASASPCRERVGL